MWLVALPATFLWESKFQRLCPELLTVVMGKWENAAVSGTFSQALAADFLKPP